MVSRRSILKRGAAITAAGAVEIPAARSSPAGPRALFVTPSDFAADPSGERNSQPSLQRAVEAAARERIPLLIEGVYRLDAPLQIMSNTSLIGSGRLRAAHTGALLTSGEATVSRVSIDGLRLEALSPSVARAIEATQWQYARLNNLRLMTAGGNFRTGFYFSNVAYWNSVNAVELESVQNAFDLGDANNLIINDVNWCRFTDIDMQSFLSFHAPCGSIYGRGLSIEGVFRDRVLIKLHPECENIDLEFLRVEGSKGSHGTTFIDFNGSSGNCLRLPPSILGLYGEAVRNARGNFVLNLNRDARGGSHLGRGEVVVPLSDTDPTLEGAINYNERDRRLRANLGGARSVALTPAIEAFDLNGHGIRNAGSVALGAKDGGPIATLSVDIQTQTLQVAFADGGTRRLASAAAVPEIRGSRETGKALESLLDALASQGIIIDRSTP